MKSIRNRLTSALLGAGAMLVVALSLTIYLGARALLRAQFDDGVRARLQAMVSLLRWHPGQVELDYKGEFMPEFEHRRGGFFFEIWTENETRPLERSHSLDGADLPRFGGSLSQPQFRELLLPDGRPARAVGVFVRRGTEQAGAVPELARAPAGPGADIVVAGETSGLQARLRTLALGIAAGGICGLGALALLVRYTLRRELAPLHSLSQRAAQLDAASLGARFPVANLPSELEPITERLNDLLARLEQAFAQERRFSANVAHELRTPIAELLALAEVGLRLSGPQPDHVNFFQDALDIAHRLDNAASTLLLLARSENGREPLERENVNLGATLESLCTRLRSEATRRKLSFTWKVPNKNLETDRRLFERLCHILLENAVEYTAAGGCVHVLLQDGEQVELTISNGPVSLDPGDIPHLSERFWRKDAARTDMHHSGLGLALAAELSRVLGMRLVPELDVTRTFRMRLILCAL